MKICKYILAFTSVMLVLTTCKKYPEGGFLNQTRLHLFGGHSVGSSKTWKLKKYEVNGIDSTYLIQGANTIPDFYDKFVTFKYKYKEIDFEYIDLSTYVYKYDSSISIKGKWISISIDFDPSNPFDLTQCRMVNNTIACARNIFVPEFNINAFAIEKKWEIKKLTKSELILSNNNLKNSYKIILTQ